MMTHGIFLVFHGFAPYNGISKKISYQIEAFKRCNIDMKLCYYECTPEGECCWNIDGRRSVPLGHGIVAKLRKRLCYHSLISYLIKNGVNFMYIRYMHNASPFLTGMVKKLRKASAKVVMEIPTYPYEQEYDTLKRKMNLVFDKCFRGALARNLDYIVTFSDYDTIFGCPTIKISNGIDFSQIKLKEQINDTSKELRLIGVAEIHFWHGFDRLIEGLGEYYKEEREYKVYFNLVGDFFSEREREEIMTPIHQYHLENYVTLYGNKQGKELDDLFEKNDVGIGSLARHRSGITKIKTLKNREYAARGIPFIYSEYDEDFEDKPYILKIPNDETPINILSIIAFKDVSKFSPEEIRNSIKNLSWEEQTKKIISKCEL